MSSKLIYYVYAYIRSKDSKTAKAGTPYYIGKGKDDRIDQLHNNVPLPKDKSNRVILECQLSELGAFAIERRMIKWYGRKDTSTGILLNRTDGGDGASGRSYIPTAEHRLKTSIANAGDRNHMYGKRHSMVTREKMKQSHKQRAPMTEEIRRKIGVGNRGKTMPQEFKEMMSILAKSRRWVNNGVTEKLSVDHTIDILHGYSYGRLSLIS